MEVTFTAQFCSHGAFSPANEQEEIHWFERHTWRNQFGAGRSFEFNFIWFRVAVELYNACLEGEESTLLKIVPKESLNE